MIPERLKSADTWIGALVTAAIAAAIFLFQATGQDPPAELVDALEERISDDGSGEPSEDIEELDTGDDIQASSPEPLTEGSGEVSGL
jgi:capsid protein